jgi:type II secretory pathway component PulF
MRHADRDRLYHELEVLISTGMPLTQALDLLTSQGWEMAALMRERARAGRPISEAIPDPFERGVVRAFEEIGQPDRGFQELVRLLEQNKKLRAQFILSMIYPLILLHAAILIPPVPALVLQGPLPYLSAVWLPLLVLWGLIVLLNTWTKPLDYVPFVGRYRKTMARARFLQTLAVLTDAGISPEHAVGLASLSSGVRVSYAAGTPLTQALTASREFSPMVLSAVQVGESSGRTGECLAKAAEIMATEAKFRLRVVMIILPIAVFLLVAAAIGYQVIRFWSDFYGRVTSI